MKPVSYTHLAQIIMKPNAVLGLATGSTPVGLYKQLIEWYNKGDLDFSQITSVNLDEYKGLSGDNDQSYRYFMNTNLFDHVNIDKTRTYVPNGLEEDSDKACADYNEIIRSVGAVSYTHLGIPVLIVSEQYRYESRLIDNQILIKK